METVTGQAEGKILENVERMIVPQIELSYKPKRAGLYVTVLFRNEGVEGSKYLMPSFRRLTVRGEDLQYSDAFILTMAFHNREPEKSKASNNTCYSTVMCHRQDYRTYDWLGFRYQHWPRTYSIGAWNKNVDARYTQKGQEFAKAKFNTAISNTGLDPDKFKSPFGISTRILEWRNTDDGIEIDVLCFGRTKWGFNGENTEIDRMEDIVNYLNNRTLIGKAKAGFYSNLRPNRIQQVHKGATIAEFATNNQRIMVLMPNGELVELTN